MPKKELKKELKKEPKKESNVSKKVTFIKQENQTDEPIDSNNIFIKKENYPYNELNLDENELQKEVEIENEDTEKLETEIDETEKDETEKDDIDEDHELDEEPELDEEETMHDMDELYDNVDNVKVKKKKKKDEDDDFDKLDDEICEYDYSEIYDEKKENALVIVENNKRITLPKLTKYEKVRLIGTRAKQISLGAKVMVKNTAGLHPIEIAKLELVEKMIPIKIKRVLADNTVEIWKLSELDI
jgi:DNA-directed RNA polymerase I, II, and III subunit RPABC2